ncbi:HdeD family acid-resistance protein [Aquabacter sp. CN5-332]|uniref:HdeD family acid-resistance protein n=1 Tax=Aquabacter sp. CN5-332 TaxID=3156608 RepID=UPI0032B4AB60
MGQLAFLLIGSDSLRKRWFVIAALGAVLTVLGLLIIFDATDGVTIVATQVFGLLFVIQGILALVSLLGTGPNVGSYLTAARGVFLLFIAGLILDFPYKNDLAVTTLFALAFIVDGMLRILTANALRYSAWRAVIAFGLFEFLIAALIITDWPIPRAKNIPFCVGLSLMFSGWVLLRMSLMLKKLEPEVAILALPMFAQRAWYDNAPVLIGLEDEAKPEHPMIVHVWTPVGSADVARRRLVLDRYIAAVDRNGVISTGHAALEAQPDLYISHYPAVEIDRSSGDFMAMFKATKENDFAGRFQPSYAVEAAGWCESDSDVIFHNYSPRRLRAFWAGYRQDNTYNLTNRNCSVAVASALDAALEGSLATKYPWARLIRLLCNPDMWVAVMLRQRAETMTWTPGYALDYARAMHRLVEPVQVSWMERLRGAIRHFRTPHSVRAASEAAPLDSKETAP